MSRAARNRETRLRLCFIVPAIALLTAILAVIVTQHPAFARGYHYRSFIHVRHIHVRQHHASRGHEHHMRFRTNYGTKGNRSHKNVIH